MRTLTISANSPSALDTEIAIAVADDDGGADHHPDEIHFSVAVAALITWSVLLVWY
jgi:hypothetical protein